MGKILERMKANREAVAKEKQKQREIYREAFRKQAHKSIAGRAKKEAKVKYGRTRGEKMASAMDEFSKLGAEFGGGQKPRQQRPRKSKRRKKQSSGSGFGDMDFDMDFDF